MCITFFFLSSDRRKRPSYILFNREESPFRLTDPLHFWHDDPNILAGRDVLGGTWMGLNVRTGNFALLTNLEDDKYHIPFKFIAESRGKVIGDFLNSEFASKWPSSEAYIDEILARADAFNPFNGLFGSFLTNKFHYLDFVKKQRHAIALDRLNGFSNNYFPENHWPKVEHGLTLLGGGQAPTVPSPENAFSMLQDTISFNNCDPDHEWSIFIRPYFNHEKVKVLATVSSSFVVLGEAEVEFWERTYSLKIARLRHYFIKKYPQSRIQALVRFCIFLRREKRFETFHVERVVRSQIGQNISSRFVSPSNESKAPLG